MKSAPVKFLTNRELLAEINRCKASYGSFLDPSFATFDVIVHDLAQATPELLAETAEKKRKPTVGLIVRLMTWEHIPLDPTAKIRGRSTNKTHAFVNFPPYKHYLNTDTGLVEVGRSHWTGDFTTGHYSVTKGRITERMGKMFYLLVDRYGRRPNWRGYSYNEDMQALALVQLSQVGLQFDESKSSNPFAFYTTTITNVFTRVFNMEKKQQTIRDDILWSEGAAPSDTRQAEHEFQLMGLKDLPAIPRKAGRPKVQRAT